MMCNIRKSLAILVFAAASFSADAANGLVIPNGRSIDLTDASGRKPPIYLRSYRDEGRSMRHGLDEGRAADEVEGVTIPDPYWKGRIEGCSRKIKTINAPIRRQAEQSIMVLRMSSLYRAHPTTVKNPHALERSIRDEYAAATSALLTCDKVHQDFGP